MIASTSFVGRTPAAAGSEIIRPVVHPLKNTSSPRSGRNTRAAAASISRLGSSMELLAQPRGQFLTGEASLPGATVPKSVDQRQQFVQQRI